MARTQSSDVLIRLAQMARKNSTAELWLKHHGQLEFIVIGHLLAAYVQQLELDQGDVHRSPFH